MTGIRRCLLPILCVLLLLPAARLAAQGAPVEEPEPLPAVEAPATPAPPRPARQPTPPRSAAGTPQPAQAQPAASRPTPAAPAAAAPTGGEAERLLRLLQDDARRAELIRTLQALTAASGTVAPAAETGSTAAAPASAGSPAPAPAAPATPAAPASPAQAVEALLAPNTLGAQLLQGASQRLTALSEQMVATVRAVADLPSLFAWLSSMARDPVTQFRVIDAAWKLALVLGLGLLCEWGVSRALTRTREKLDSRAPEEGEAWSWLRKVPLVIARLGLDLLPIGAFAVVSYGLIGAVQPLPTTELVMLTVNNAYMASRAVMVASRMALSPASPMLRLLPVGDETAAYITVWLRRITLVMVFGYAVAEAGLQFGLPWSAYDSILRVCALLVTLFLVIVILQNRTHVSDALRAPPLPEGQEVEPGRRLLRNLRDRAAEIWHFLAIAWLIAAWGVWALEVQGGFWRLARVSLLTLLVLVGSRLVDMGMRRALQRAFRISPDLSRRYPGLEERANRYLPVLKGMLSAFIGFIAVLLLLEVWGLEAFSWFGQGKLGSRLMGSLASIGFTILAAMAAWEAANAAIQRHLLQLSRDAKAARSARVRTLLPMLRTALLITILVIVAFIILTEIGVNVAPLIAGAGVVGIAIGFGSQTLVRDVITGVFLLFEDAVAVGDVVQVGGLSGVVEQLSIRSIKLRAMDGSLHIIPFSAVTTVTNMTRDFAFAVVDVSIAYGEDTDRVSEVLKGIAAELREDVKWRPVIRDDLDILGVERLADSGVVIRVRLKTDPSQRWAIARELNRRIKRRFDELGIEIPYPHQKLVLEKGMERHPAEVAQASE
ncbi:mechanosensitive ion channel [Roseomonas sp. HJA6]|uniref:Mechanosensitive ion channel n=1 Tax=Roseomonas alba TaxID=2846776 RepID=A0ABS7A758_9PROT|nr:mechanosensitive ion channel domain-containing protein [Neoroseomonas alba]MBW6397145.1 mechanosensitive ion channel [Neoroseomonas alba]